MAEVYLYIGRLKSKEADDSKWSLPEGGISVCKFNTDTGKITFLRNIVHEGLGRIGKVQIDSSRGIYYYTDESENYPGAKDGGGGGAICACRINRADGSVDIINSKPSFGSKPSYVCFDKTGKYLLITNHGSRSNTTATEKDAFGNFYIRTYQDESNVVLYSLNEDGSIGSVKDIFRVSGSGPKYFQKGPHAHCVLGAPGRNLYVVCDKGGDQIYVLSIDYENEKLVNAPGSPLHRFPGSAPRYCAFHPILPYVYVNKETECRMSAFRYEDSGYLEEIQLLKSTVPGGFTAPGPVDWGQSDLQIDKSGRHCYLFIRITNIINVYDIDQTTGRLFLKQTVSTKGGGRMSSFSPYGRFLVVSYQDDGLVDVFSVNGDGTLGGIVDSVRMASPAALNFYEA